MNMAANHVFRLPLFLIGFVALRLDASVPKHNYNVSNNSSLHGIAFLLLLEACSTSLPPNAISNRRVVETWPNCCLSTRQSTHRWNWYSPLMWWYPSSPRPMWYQWEWWKEPIYKTSLEQFKISSEDSSFECSLHCVPREFYFSKSNSLLQWLTYSQFQKRG